MKIQFKKISAGVAELADAPDLGSGGFTVGVQVPSPAPMPEGRLTEVSVTDPFHYGKISANRFDRYKIAVLFVAISANNRNKLRLFAEIIAYCIVIRDYLCYNKLQYLYLSR